MYGHATDVEEWRDNISDDPPRKRRAALISRVARTQSLDDIDDVDELLVALCEHAHGADEAIKDLEHRNDSRRGIR